MRLILAAEGNSTLKIDPNFGQPSHSAGRDGWIEQVFSMAITGLKLRQMTQAFENVAFINFNYDRCIEHYLFWSFQRIGLPANDAAEMVQNLNMVRPYGSLGSILSGSKNYLQFGAGRIPEPFSVIERIRTFTESEAMHDPAALSKLLSSSEMIIFLGFGFHPQNMELLTIQQRPQSYLGVLATTYMVDAANLRALQGAITRSLRAPGKVVETFSMTASEFLKKLRMRITLTVG